jgi:hypothetical protein
VVASLAELLSKLPIDSLVRISRANGIVCGTHSKRQLTRAIQDNFRKTEFLRHVINSWGEQVRATLAFLLLSPDSQDFLSRPNHLSEVEDESGQDGYQVILESHRKIFRTHGFLLPQDGREREESLWVIPRDLRKNLSTLLIHPKEEPIQPDPGPPAKRFQSGSQFLEDLFTTLVFARKESIRLTRSGNLFKKTQEKLEEYFLIPQDEFLEDIPPEYPDRLEFMVGFAVRNQILLEEGREMQTTRNLDHWMNQPDEGKLISLFHYLQRTYIQPDPGLHRVLSFLKDEPAFEGWMPIEGPIRSCYGSFPSDAWWLPRLRSRVYWLFHVLMHLGFVELARLEATGETAYRWLPAGEFFLRQVGPKPRLGLEGGLTVQPDFEIFLSQKTGLNVRWQVERIADLLSRDVVYRYRINRDAVYRGLKWGATLQEILIFLKAHAERPLPENVVHDLQTWADQYGNISFADVLLMRCQSEQTARELKVSPEISPLIRGEITPVDLVISRKDYSQMLRVLERNGYLPKPGVDTFEAPGQENQGG